MSSINAKRVENIMGSFSGRGFESPRLHKPKQKILKRLCYFSDQGRNLFQTLVRKMTKECGAFFLLWFVSPPHSGINEVHSPGFNKISKEHEVFFIVMVCKAPLSGINEVYPTVLPK
jgi:hypothetical protein